MSAESTSLNGKQVQAALLVAEDELTDQQIADRLDVSQRTLERWKLKPEFQTAVKAHIDRLQTELSRYSIARKDRRVAEYNERWHLLKQVREARAANPDVPDAQGGRTGLVVRQIELDRDGCEHEVFAVDTGMLAEMRNLEKQAAVEVGQWTERKELGGTVIVRQYVGISEDDA
jgi:hypothetical protein